MTYSFSRLSSFYQCKREWKKRYIDCEQGTDSAMGQFGSFCHKILELYSKGYLSIFELSSYYEDHYNEEVNIPFPNNNYVDLSKNYYESGLNYFNNFNTEYNNIYNILGVEKEVKFNINNYDMIGYIDLLLQNKDNNEITILDHKSATIKINKNGKISKGDQEHFESFKRQLYLYCIPIIKEYGHVDWLEWNMFKQGNTIRIHFDQSEYEAAIQWAIDTIKQIEQEQEYLPNPDYFYCCNLCSVRNTYCPYRRLGIIYKTIYSKCYNTKNSDFESFGGLGIGFCEEWKNDRQNFFNWALENGYDEGVTLKRIDEFSDFSPDNCYWETMEVTDSW